MEKKRLNKPLLLGLGLFMLIVVLAIAGPSLAPRDPLEENLIIQLDNGKWLVPPFRIFTPGFPLGSDAFGRDLLSRLLFAIRPTLVMVAIVALVRLFLGILIGLLAGWSSGRLARTLDGLIALALSIPVLLVALGAIAVVGAELGIWAFILGLALTGWVETAQQVREQTRIVKGQVYVEAAHALGASNRQILSRHVLKQILPMVAMLFAFEASSTLMATAGLGFLGYYIGGDVWVTTQKDYVYRRISGMPELGQMLATSWAVLTQPWAMVVVGSTIFLAVLAFNLTGEGLRQSLDLAVVRRRGFLAETNERIGFWLDQNVWYPLSLILEKPAVRMVIAGALVVVVLVVGGGSIWGALKNTLPNIDQILSVNPDSTPLAEATSSGLPREANQGTEASSPSAETPGSSAIPGTPVPDYSPEIAWQFEDNSGFRGGPFLSTDGSRMYAASAGGQLYALDLQGNVIWQVDLAAGDVGTPAVAENGDVLLSDDKAGLSRLTPEGELIWRFQSEAAGKSISGSSIGPDGTLYYTVATPSHGFVQAVSPDGKGLWAAEAKTPSFYEQPVPSSDGKYVYLKNDLFNAKTGELVELESDLKILRFFNGEDGRSYMLSGNNAIQWQQNGSAIEVVDLAEWDTGGLEFTAPHQLGVTREHIAWMLYSSPGGKTSINWVSMDDKTIGSAVADISGGEIVAMLDDFTSYVCGGPPFDNNVADCVALLPDEHEPLWKLRLGSVGRVQGGFYLDGKLYVTTQDGILMAITEKSRSATERPGSVGSNSAQGALTPGAPGLLWTYNLDEDVIIGPLISDQATSFFVTSENNLVSVNSDGELRYEITLPSAPFYEDSSSFSGYFWPFLLQDETLIFVSEDHSVYAVGPDGALAWEQPLDAKPLLESDQTESDIVYIADQGAGLYAFNRDGLLWRFKSTAAGVTASGPVSGPDGVVYYTVTNRNTGFVEALSPEGKQLWNAQAETGAFYEPLLVSPDGDLLFLKEEIYRTDTGERLEYELPYRVDEFIMGLDGEKYLRTGSHIVHWDYGPNGFQEIETVSWDTSKAGNFPPHVIIDHNHVIWLNYFDQLMLLDLKGRVLQSYRQEYETHLYYQDWENTRLTDCAQPLRKDVFQCETYVPGTKEPVWQVNLPDVPAGSQIFWQGDYIYTLTEDGSYVRFYLGQPG